MDVSLNTTQVNADKTMTLLWSRVRQRGDLPGFSKVVSAIVNAMRGDDDREFSMTKTVLQDPALTQKVLRLANSAMYSVFGQGINTVSKAAIVLGTEAIGHLALGLKLVDGLSAASAESASTREEMEKALLAGHIARQVASSASMRDVEEAVVCSMLHSLGRMMTVFYLSDRWKQIQEQVQNDVDESEAVLEALGLGLDDIGRQVAQQWGLPARLVNTLQDMPPKQVGEPISHEDWLSAVSTLSSRCASTLCTDTAADNVLPVLARDYADMLGLEASQLLTAVETAQKVAADEGSVAAPKVRRADTEIAGAQALDGKPADAAARLARGVADMQGVLQSANTAQLLSMALETVYQGLGFSHAVAFLRNQKEGKYKAQMCFGESVQELLPRLIFGDAYQPDVFHAALAKDKMIFVENAQEEEFASKLPRWWKDALPGVKSFMVLPLTTNRQPVGFIYGDWDSSKPTSKIEQDEVVSLNELRLLITRAMEQRRLAELAFPGQVTNKA